MNVARPSLLLFQLYPDDGINKRKRKKHSHHNRRIHLFHPPVVRPSVTTCKAVAAAAYLPVSHRPSLLTATATATASNYAPARPSHAKQSPAVGGARLLTVPLASLRRRSPECASPAECSPPRTASTECRSPSGERAHRRAGLRRRPPPLSHPPARTVAGCLPSGAPLVRRAASAAALSCAALAPARACGW
ncbi:hypothetical protein GUJ93_ZPchr0008g12035 [Zizania palustris]|uniref:Uncharacterized protein n=1 Tax=Zizania palustris TaxID=103762 RepID=A0A8J5VHP5_ZIZPA|nr:hypothetical protein GUJ93_ZPchr0008g12035 [Zizania palustris]